MMSLIALTLTPPCFPIPTQNVRRIECADDYKQPLKADHRKIGEFKTRAERREHIHKKIYAAVCNGLREAPRMVDQLEISKTCIDLHLTELIAEKKIRRERSGGRGLCYHYLPVEPISSNAEEEEPRRVA